MSESSIDVEPLISFTEASKLKWLPRRRQGKRPHVSWFYRQATSGTRGVRLESRRCGSTLVTSEGALRRFFRALSDLPPTEAITTPTKPITKHEVAEAELAAAGI